MEHVEAEGQENHQNAPTIHPSEYVMDYAMRSPTSSKKQTITPIPRRSGDAQGENQTPKTLWLPTNKATVTKPRVGVPNKDLTSIYSKKNIKERRTGPSPFQLARSTTKESEQEIKNNREM